MEIKTTNKAPAPVGQSRQVRPHLEALFVRLDPPRGRLVFAIDATASRGPTWDLAAKLQQEMFAAVAAIGGLEIRLVWYRGTNEFQASPWFTDARGLRRTMAEVSCRAGPTQIWNVLNHARKTHAADKISALIFVGDACEEIPADLYSEARELGIPAFMFQEGDDPRITGIYGEIARLTGGAYAKFDADAAQHLADLLKAVAAFATGGLKALAAQKTEAATLLLTQLKS